MQTVGGTGLVTMAGMMPIQEAMEEATSLRLGSTMDTLPAGMEDILTMAEALLHMLALDTSLAMEATTSTAMVQDTHPASSMTKPRLTDTLRSP